MTATEFGAGPRVTTSDGVEIATYDFDGDGPWLLLAHATGFHGRAWLPVAQSLRGQYHCVAFDARGHGDSGQAPGGNYDWSGFGLDVLAVVEAMRHRPPGPAGPLLGVGHSAGGAALFLAEQAEPGSFEALYCYEPVVPTPDSVIATGTLTGSPLAEGARRRRPIFASRAAALDNYQAKATFAGFDPAALAAYVEWGFHDRSDGTVELACRPEDEARIYENAPTNGVFARLDRVTCPVTIAAGGRGALFRPEGVVAVAQKIAGKARVERHEHLGHFGPFERPGEIAASVVAAFADPP